MFDTANKQRPLGDTEHVPALYAADFDGSNFRQLVKRASDPEYVRPGSLRLHRFPGLQQPALDGISRDRRRGNDDLVRSEDESGTGTGRRASRHHEGHGWALVPNRIDFWTRVEKFLERNIGKP